MSRNHPMKCAWCAGDRIHPLSTCPRSVKCPACSADPGRPCLRPSEHEVFGGQLHAGRIEKAEKMDRDLGLVYVCPDPADSETDVGFVQLEILYELTRKEMAAGELLAPAGDRWQTSSRDAHTRLFDELTGDLR